VTFQKKHFSGIIKGIKTLHIAQIYLHDISEKIETQEKLFKSQNNFKQLSNYLEESLENERKNISRELHDVIGQKLHILKMKVQNTNDNTKLNPENVINQITEIYTDVRNISRALKPPLMEEFGVAAAVNSFINTSTQDSNINGTFSLIGHE
jgi:two-component system sensor histidine kinase UhpB